MIMNLMWAKMLSSIAVCGLGIFSMWITKGNTGVGWAILGVFLIWAA